MGDIGFPMFSFARILRLAPPVIAQEIVKILNEDSSLREKTLKIGVFVAVGPYVNVKLIKSDVVRTILETIFSQEKSYGAFDKAGTKHLDGRRVMIDFKQTRISRSISY